MNFVTRRMFLRQGTVAVAAAGLVASTGLPLLSEIGASPELAGGASVAPEITEAGQLAEPVVAHVGDLTRGTIDLFVGGRHVVFDDPGLAHAIVRASR